MKQCISTSALLTSICIFIAVLFMMPISAQAANTQGDYAGYYTSKIQASDRVDLYAMYVTPKSNYVSGQPVTSSDAEIAYCFNKQKAWPRNNADGLWVDTFSGSTDTYQVNGLTLYTKVPDVSGSVFANYAGSRRITDADEFRAKIVSICLNGYPYDYSGINKDNSGRQILSSDVFRAITQYAIWYYTDSDVDESQRGWTDAEKTVFRDLVDMTLPSYITDSATSAIDLYLWDGNAAFDSSDSATQVYKNGTLDNSGYTDPYSSVKGYQNLLAIRTAELSRVTSSIAAPKTLTVSKATTGVLNGKFTFKITLDAGTTYWVNEQNADNVKDDGNGNLVVTLEKDESVSLKILSPTYSYTVEETGASAYKTTISVKQGDGTVSATNPKVVSGTNVMKNTLIQYTNTDPNEVPFIKTNTVPPIITDVEEYKELLEYIKDTYGPVTIDYSGNIWKDGVIVDNMVYIINTARPILDTTVPSKAKVTPDTQSDDVAVQDEEVVEEASPKTADSSNLLFWLVIAVICAAVMRISWVKKKSLEIKRL